MPQIADSAAAATPLGAPGPDTAHGVLHHLGQLLRIASTPSDTDRFATLLAELDASGTDAADAEVRARLPHSMPNPRRFAVSLTRPAARAILGHAA